MKFRTLCKSAFWLVASLGAGVVCLAVVVGPPTPRADFEKGTAGWFSPSRGGQVQPLSEARVGKGALRFSYQVQAGSIPGVGTVRLMVAGGQGVRLWIRTSEPSNLVLAMEEKGGARYLYRVETADNTWQQFEADFDRFTLAPDTRDENGRLDSQDLKSVLFVADLDGMLQTKTRPQHLDLDQVEVTLP